MPWRLLDHTADVALEVEATTFPELLAEAARAFGEWLSEGQVAGSPHVTERELEARGADRVETWVAFWRGLLRLWTVEGFLAAGARVDADDDGREARARVACVSAGALDPGRCADVKAVTWHAARVERVERAVAAERALSEPRARWRGTIVLDL